MIDILFVGEGWSEKDEEAQAPLTGAAGWIFDQLLSAAGVSRRECEITNVFNFRVTDIKKLCGGRAEGLVPELIRGKYLRKEYAGSLDALYQLVKVLRPNLVVALGPTAAWAFLQSTGIEKVRGAIAPSSALTSSVLGFVQKVLPTYSPAMVLRNYSERLTTIADFTKARRESAFPDIRRPVRDIWLYPDLDDLARYEAEHIVHSALLSVDIETKGDQITCIGFAPDPHSCIVIPLFQGENRSYWSTPDEERQALTFVRRWLTLAPSVFQNGMYDITFLWRRYGIPTPLAAEDTMLLHHAWQPEMKKGLGFLGTIYTDEASWKHMRKGMKHD